MDSWYLPRRAPRSPAPFRAAVGDSDTELDLPRPPGPMWVSVSASGPSLVASVLPLPTRVRCASRSWFLLPTSTCGPTLRRRQRLYIGSPPAGSPPQSPSSLGTRLLRSLPRSSLPAAASRLPRPRRDPHPTSPTDLGIGRLISLWGIRIPLFSSSPSSPTLRCGAAGVA
ncbi:hypothetical protein DFH08DRAFT_458177 [Mycena albidolilacea]|uniref:Uncharacterized protein n=1 Tax=Mycena albidolilacea TaxID=1033008 RepID=A0AAD7EBU6_9AGAR|nr:hypothetical protein DFH08DRAFT_458177 [Mycena albidolilacea]